MTRVLAGPAERVAMVENEADGQSALGDFGGGDDRPTAEAVAVAGDGGGRVSEVVDREEVRFPDADGETALAVTQVDYTIEGSGDEE